MFNASIVLYRHDPEDIFPLLNSLLRCRGLRRLFLLDNSPEATKAFDHLPVIYHFNGRNLGYGAAHNIAIRKSLAEAIPYHLVLNPDISLDPSVLTRLEAFMDEHPDAGLVMPKVLFPNGETQYLCKLLPTPANLLFRRFLPPSWTMRRRHRFELRHTGYNRTMDVPYLSGCFMFLRCDTLREVGVFDERFFLYPEDIDLSRRIHRRARTLFFPEVSVEHRHEQGSYKNTKLLLLHLVNMARYFGKWGWVFDAERREINRRILRSWKQDEY